MPGVRGLEWYVRNAELVKTASLDVLKGVILGVDAVSYLRSPDCNVDANRFHGGDHGYSQMCLHEQLEVLRAHFSPLFVFPGCTVTAVSEESMQRAMHDNLAEERWQAWQAVSSRKFKTAVSVFRQECRGGFVDEEQQGLLWALVNALKQDTEGRAIHAMRAPTSDVAKQLKQLHNEKFIHSAYGGLDLLLLGFDRVVLSIDHDEETCEFIVLDDVLTKLELTFPQFVDLCALAGHGSLSFPPAVLMRGRNRNKTPQFQFQRVVEAVQTHGSAANVLTHFATDASLLECDFASEFKKTRARIDDFCGVFDHASARVLGTPEAEASSAMLSFFASSSPSSFVVQMLMKGAIYPSLVSSAIFDATVYLPPPVDSENYSLLCEEMVTHRFASVHDVQRAISPTSAVRKLTHRAYYRPDVVGGSEEGGNLPNALEEWKEPVNQPQEKPALEVASLCRARVFATWGLTDRLAALGEAVEAPADTLSVLCVLMEKGVLNGDAMRIVKPGSEELEVLRVVGADVSDARSIRLISRVCSVLPGGFAVNTSEAWTGPLDHETSAFVCMQRLVAYELRMAAQAALALWMTRDPHASLARLDEIVAELPFRETTQVDSMGVLMKEFLVSESPPQPSAPAHDDGLESKDADAPNRNARMEQLGLLFPQVADVADCLHTLVRFYLSVSKFARANYPDVAVVFEDADRFLDGFLAKAL